jgi:hypothetical protein
MQLRMVRVGQAASLDEVTLGTMDRSADREKRPSGTRSGQGAVRVNS